MTGLPASLTECLPDWSNLVKHNPLARRDWILWKTTTKHLETRLRRIEKATEMLARGLTPCMLLRRLNLAYKNATFVETWLQLPDSESVPR